MGLLIAAHCARPFFLDVRVPGSGSSSQSARGRCTMGRKRREDHGSGWLLTAPAYRAVFVQLTRWGVRERSSMEATLLELLAAAAWAGIVPADALERVNKRLGHVGKGQTNILRTGCPSLLILLGCIRESVPARELANRILKWSDQVVLETGHAL